MNIRRTRQEDLAEVMAMYDYARRFMQEHGNGNQWINGYPSEELISNEIKASHSFVCENEQGELVGTFCYIEGIDPTYLKIYEGEWLNDEPYAVIHRMASNGKQKGISTECLKWAFAHFGWRAIEWIYRTWILKAAVCRSPQRSSARSPAVQRWRSRAWQKCPAASRTGR